MKVILRVAAWSIALIIFGIGGWLYFQQRQVLDSNFFDELNTGLLNFDVTWIARIDASQNALGGGMAVHPEGIFLNQKAEEGLLFFLDADTDKLLETGTHMPVMNRSAIPSETPSGIAINRDLLRYNDLLLRTHDGQEHLLVSYSYFDEQEQCFTSRLAETDLPEGWLVQLRGGARVDFGDWRVAFETSPCLPIVDNTGFPFTGHQAGGRMAENVAGDVYLTTGDYGFDGLEGKLPPHPHLPDSGYGKVIRLTPTETGDWSDEIIAQGLRNPQGITIDAAGRIWSTDHGPMGGDELNLIEPGADYGWPEVTMGVNYVGAESDDKYWPFNPEQGLHPGYRVPVYTWIPSIAPANVKYIDGLSPRWDGDLLVGALKQGSLVRLRMDNGHVVTAEHIGLLRRVRYVEIAHGRLYILFDYGELAILTPHEMSGEYVEFEPLIDEVYDPQNPGAVPLVAAGSILSSRGCLQCHGSPGTPSLTGLYGRDIANQPNINYSGALRSKGGDWTEDNLRSFLSDTQNFAPGTTMPSQSLSEDDIAEIIEALKFRQDT